jgi:probable F420-dependent oxidoreductase
MKFFLSGLGNWSKDLALITEAVVEADRLGYDGAVMPDHYMWGEMEWHKRPDSNSTLDTWVTLTYLAAKTEQIRLGTLVTPIPFRSPSMLAKMLATLDVLSKGRVVLGVGAGWSQVEFEGYGEWNEPKIRVDKTKEGIELMTRLWTQDKVTFEGRYYHARAAVLEPKPVQKPYPPLLFGGRGERMLRLAGKYADICYVPQFRDGESYEEGKRKVLKAAERLNRANHIAFMAGGVSAEGPYRSEEYSKRIEAAREAGASFFLTAFPRDEPIIDVMRKFASEVMPLFR